VSSTCPFWEKRGDNYYKIQGYLNLSVCCNLVVTNGEINVLAKTYKMIQVWISMERIGLEKRNKIKEESKKFLEEFSRKLDKLKGDFGDSSKSEEARKEGSGWENDSEFREIMFQNAPFVEADLIIAEKGAWK
jgi:hypothetical protein